MYKVSIFLFIIIYIISCNNVNPTLHQKKNLSKEQASLLIALPQKCLHKEWPNKLNQVLATENEIGTPSELHPIFFGCFDWHSSVHGHWTILRLHRAFPEINEPKDIKNLFDKNWTKKNIEIELNYFNRISEKSFERPYGWAWLLKLAEELYIQGQKDPFWKDKYNLIQPLCNNIIDKYYEFYPNLTYPVRSGEHTNSAYGLNLAYDYAKTVEDKKLIEFIKKESLRLFIKDKKCPLNWEPSGFDFISSCLEEAFLISKVMNSKDYETWLKEFLPVLWSHDFELKPAQVKDREDGKLVHIDGYNYSAAKCLYGIANVLPELTYLNRSANNLIEATLPKITDGRYAGEHWLASFAVLALLE